VLQAAPIDPFAHGIRPINELLQFSQRSNANHRVRVRGVVTGSSINRGLYMQDSTGGLEIQAESDSVESGD